MKHSLFYTIYCIDPVFNFNGNLMASCAVCVCALCGLPAVGKSSFAQAISGYLEKLGWITFVISYDDLMRDDAFDLNLSVVEDDSSSKGQSRWKQHRQEVLSCLESFLQEPRAPRPCEADGAVWRRFMEAMALQKVPAALQRSPSGPACIALLLDDNFYYQSMRYEVYQLARKYSVGFCQLYLHCPVEVCLHRNQVRSHPVPDEVIVDMSKRMEPPNTVKNQWEWSSLHLNSLDSITDSNMQRVLELISSALENPISPVQNDLEQKQADRERCAVSIVHQLDQACRRLVSETMLMARDSNTSPGVMKALAQELTKVKGDFLQELRAHFLQQALAECVQEQVDVERVVSRTLPTFQQRRDDVLLRHGINTTDLTV